MGTDGAGKRLVSWWMGRRESRMKREEALETFREVKEETVEERKLR